MTALKTNSTNTKHSPESLCKTGNCKWKRLWKELFLWVQPAASYVQGSLDITKQPDNITVEYRHHCWARRANACKQRHWLDVKGQRGIFLMINHVGEIFKCGWADGKIEEEEWEGRMFNQVFLRCKNKLKKEICCMAFSNICTAGDTGVTISLKVLKCINPEHYVWPHVSSATIGASATFTCHYFR